MIYICIDGLSVSVSGNKNLQMEGHYPLPRKHILGKTRKMGKTPINNPNLFLVTYYLYFWDVFLWINVFIFISSFFWCSICKCFSVIKWLHSFILITTQGNIFSIVATEKLYNWQIIAIKFESFLFFYFIKTLISLSVLLSDKQFL